MVEMSQCYDLDVELHYPLGAALGLGDVVFPGFLIAYCFFIDVMRRELRQNEQNGPQRSAMYGAVALIGLAILHLFIYLRV